MKSSTNTLNRLVWSTEFTTVGQFQVSKVARVRRPTRANKAVQNAVYGYIRAVRALGRTKITTAEVSEALSLPIAEVHGALSSLKKRGVRTLNA